MPEDNIFFQSEKAKGTLLYMAPEVLCGSYEGKITQKIDVYGLVTIIAQIFGAPEDQLFSRRSAALEDLEKQEKIGALPYDRFLEIKKNIDVGYPCDGVLPDGFLNGVGCEAILRPWFKQILGEMQSVDPDERPDCADLLKSFEWLGNLTLAKLRKRVSVEEHRKLSNEIQDFLKDRKPLVQEAPPNLLLKLPTKI